MNMTFTNIVGMNYNFSQCLVSGEVDRQIDVQIRWYHYHAFADGTMMNTA